MAKHHYVYALTSPLDYGKAFYIGKGSGDRRVKHFHSVSKEMAGAETSDKFKIIKAIRDAGLQPSAIVLSHHDDEEAALTEERRVIAEIGLHNLVNKSIGGEGVKAAKKPTTKKTVSEKQEHFCQLMVGGKNGTASDCYRLAYNATKMKKKTINEAASRLMADSKVIARIEELRAPVVKATRYDLEWCLGRQNDAADLAEMTGNAGALTGAVREIGRLTDVYPSEKAELTLKGDELAVRLQQGRAKLAEEDT
jgi:phage terminase small subunit